MYIEIVKRTWEANKKFFFNPVAILLGVVYALGGFAFLLTLDLSSILAIATGASWIIYYPFVRLWLFSQTWFQKYVPQWSISEHVSRYLSTSRRIDEETPDDVSYTGSVSYSNSFSSTVNITENRTRQTAKNKKDNAINNHVIIFFTVRIMLPLMVLFLTPFLFWFAVPSLINAGFYETLENKDTYKGV